MARGFDLVEYRGISLRAILPGSAWAGLAAVFSVPALYVLTGADPALAELFFFASLAVVLALAGWALATALHVGTNWRFEAAMMVGAYLAFGVMVQCMVDGILGISLATNYNGWGVLLWPLYAFSLGQCGFRYSPCI